MTMIFYYGCKKEESTNLVKNQTPSIPIAKKSQIQDVQVFEIDILSGQTKNILSELDKNMIVVADNLGNCDYKICLAESIGTMCAEDNGKVEVGKRKIFDMTFLEFSQNKKELNVSNPSCGETSHGRIKVFKNKFEFMGDLHTEILDVIFQNFETTSDLQQLYSIVGNYVSQNYPSVILPSYASLDSIMEVYFGGEIENTPSLLHSNGLITQKEKQALETISNLIKNSEDDNSLGTKIKGYELSLLSRKDLTQLEQENLLAITAIIRHSSKYWDSQIKSSHKWKAWLNCVRYYFWQIMAADGYSAVGGAVGCAIVLGTVSGGNFVISVGTAATCAAIFAAIGSTWQVYKRCGAPW